MSQATYELVRKTANILMARNGDCAGNFASSCCPHHDMMFLFRSVFGIPVVSDDNRDSSPRAARPIRSALVLTKPSAAGAGAVPPAAPSTSAQHEPVVAPVPASLVRPTDFFDGGKHHRLNKLKRCCTCQLKGGFPVSLRSCSLRIPDLSMIAEQSHLDDLDLDSVGVGGAARRSSRSRFLHRNKMNSG